MDSDVIEFNNLGHQRFNYKDVGTPKVQNLADRLNHSETPVKIIAHQMDLKESTQLQGWDAIVVAVDNPHPRRLVHNSGIPWLDLRCKDGGWFSMTYEMPKESVRKMTNDHAPTGCISEKAFENANIQFGFAGAAVFGTQWTFQCIRRIQGEEVRLPQGMIFYFDTGTMELPKMEVK